MGRAIVFVVVLLAGLPALADSLADLLAAKRCPLDAQLRAVHDRPSAFKERDRFLVISVKQHPQWYVQCMFAANRTKLYCEASSGYYAERAETPRTTYLSPDSTAALARLGFAIGAAEKNFSYERELTVKPDFDAIATFMLTVLHDGYGVGAETELETIAPFSGNLVVACRR